MNAWKAIIVILLILLLWMLILGTALLRHDNEPRGVEFIDCNFIEPNEVVREHPHADSAEAYELKYDLFKTGDGIWNDIVRKWPRVVVDPNYEYTGERIRERAISDGLTAWGLCMAGNSPPKGFGDAMIKVGNIVGVLATLENLMKVEFDEVKE